MNYKLVSYKVILNSTIDLGPDVTPVGITQTTPTEFYLMCLEPVEEVEEKKVEGDEEP